MYDIYFRMCVVKNLLTVGKKLVNTNRILNGVRNYNSYLISRFAGILSIITRRKGTHAQTKCTKDRNHS